MKFGYAHINTATGERRSPTYPLNAPRICKQIQALRVNAFERQIPTADDETLNFLITLLSALQPKTILELGTAVGISGAAMLDICGAAHLTTVEREPSFHSEALKNFNRLGFSQRVTAICGDAGEVVNTLDSKFDFIFLDCAKVQYVKYLPRLKTLLKSGGVLLADDVLLFGWLTGETPVPEKRRMLYTHIKEYVDAVTNDKELETAVLNLGDGLAMSVKK